MAGEFNSFQNIANRRNPMYPTGDDHRLNCGSSMANLCHLQLSLTKVIQLTMSLRREPRSQNEFDLLRNLLESHPKATPTSPSNIPSNSPNTKYRTAGAIVLDY